MLVYHLPSRRGQECTAPARNCLVWLLCFARPSGPYTLSPALDSKVFEPSEFSLLKKRLCDFGKPVPGAQLEDILGRQTAVHSQGGHRQYSVSVPLLGQDINISDESRCQKAPMTLGLSKAHAIFLGNGHFSKAFTHQPPQDYSELISALHSPTLRESRIFY